jgi:hypothetical protein
LSLDLPNADSEQRRKFDEAMSKRNWTKIHGVSTIWTANCRDLTAAQALKETSKDLGEAGDAAGLKKVRAAVHFGPNEPSLFELTA